MRYLKALIKTIKQIDKDNRYFLYGFSLVILSIVICVVSGCIKSDILDVIGVTMIFIGFGFIFKPMWDDTKDDIKKFFKRVKSNIE